MSRPAAPGRSPEQEYDPLRWLENPVSPAALAWARERTAEALDRLCADPLQATIADELRALASLDDTPVFLAGPSHLVRLRRSPSQPRGVLSVSAVTASSADPQWHDVLDIGALRDASGVSYEFSTALGATSFCGIAGSSRCMLGFSLGGSDQVEAFEFDLASASFVEGGFHVPPGRIATTWLDRDTMLVQHGAHGAPLLVTGYPAATYLWRRGDRLAEAREIFRAAAADVMSTLCTVGRPGRRVGVIVQTVDFATFRFHAVDAAGRVELIPLPSAVRLKLRHDQGSHLVVQLASAAVIDGHPCPAESIVAFGPADGASVVHTPAPGEFVVDADGGVGAAGGLVRLVLNRRGVERVATFERQATGWIAHFDAPAPVGTSITIVASQPLGQGAIVRRSGLLEPTRVSLLAAGGNEHLLFREPELFDAGRFRVELRVAQADDGIEIDYFVLRPAGLQDGPVPLLMTGYGAFGVSVQPGYCHAIVGGRTIVPWLTRGGALALPLIRGGGERGAAWHQAALREHRQRSYDDFAAVTAALIAEGIAAPDRIGVFGSSNGGLLAAVMGIRHPDLYAAIVSDVPLADMLRLPFMGMGSAWTEEYGDPREPAMGAVLRRYSPCQQVRPGRRYPPFLIIAATNDDRVGPGHARKLAACLEAAGARPLFVENDDGGHGTSNLIARGTLMSGRMAFLVRALMRPY